MTMSPAVIRPFAPADTEACYEICLRTADDGNDATALHADPRLPGEIWVGPYLTRWPEFAFVVEDDDGVGGYIVGTPDTVAHERWMEDEWLPPLRSRYPVDRCPAGTADADSVNLIHAPPTMAADVVADYPAHLHIDQLSRMQGRGLGRQLMAALLAACRSADVAAIHLACSPENTRAVAFYRHLGFEDLVGGMVWGRSTAPL